MSDLARNGLVVFEKMHFDRHADVYRHKSLFRPIRMSFLILNVYSAVLVMNEMRATLD